MDEENVELGALLLRLDPKAARRPRGSRAIRDEAFVDARMHG
jgi:hypothetical protein